MRKQKTIHTALEIKGVLFLVEEAKMKFPSNTVIGKDEFENISLEIVEDYKRKFSSSSVRRIFNLKEKPHPLSYEKLDSFTVWCFDNIDLYPNFRTFIEKRQQDIEQSNLVSKTDLKLIIEFLKTDSKAEVVESKPLVIKLASSPFELKLKKGNTQKLLKEIAHVTGDLLKEDFISNPYELTSYFKNYRIKRRVELKYERQQENIENIVAKAIEVARQKEVSDEPVDSDWVVEFFNIAQDCSDNNMQYLWARLLADEIQNPNSFSRRTLSSIKLLNSYEAKVFTKLCSCVWDLEESHFGKEKMLIKDMDSNGRYSDETWDFDGSFISHLEEVGLVYDSFLQLDEKKNYKATFFGEKHNLKAKVKEQQIDVVALTQVGQEIFKIVNPKPNYEYYNSMLKYFKDTKILKK